MSQKLEQLKKDKQEIWETYQKVLLGQKIFTQEEIANLLADFHCALTAIIELVESHKNNS